LDQLARWDYRCTRALASNAWWEAVPTKVPSLLDCCRLKLEQMVLLGQVTILQLSPLVEHYIARLPRRHAARFVTSLFAKSITHWFPCKYAFQNAFSIYLFRRELTTSCICI
jgi:hypothetical protein